MTRGVFPIGVIELRLDSVRLYNRTSDRTISGLTSVQVERWRQFLTDWTSVLERQKHKQRGEHIER